MGEKTFSVIKIISVFFGLADILGFFWFLDYSVADPIPIVIFSLSTAMALLTLPFIPEALLRSLMARLFFSLLGILGLLNATSEIISSLKVPNPVDTAANILFRTIVVTILVILITRIVHPKLVKVDRENRTG